MHERKRVLIQLSYPDFSSEISQLRVPSFSLCCSTASVFVVRTSLPKESKTKRIPGKRSHGIRKEISYIYIGQEIFDIFDEKESERERSSINILRQPSKE